MRLTASACCELSAAHSAQQIKRVDASNQDVEEVDDLSSLTSLIRLDLNDNPRLTSLEPALRSTAGSLKHLVAARCPGLSPSLPGLLPRGGLSLPRLRVVDLSSCGLSAFDAAPAPKLAALILTGNPGIAISGLAACPELATLVVKGCDLTDGALQLALRGAASLSKLSAARNRLRGGDKLDLSALRGSLSELRLGHNDLRALPRGLSPRLRLLDVGGNARLGPLARVAGELSRVAAAAAAGAAGGGAPGGGSWLRSVTLRGTAAALEEGYEAAIAAAAPALRVLDDKKVASRDFKAPPAAAAGAAGGGVEVGREKRKKERPSVSTVARGKLAGETGLSLPPPPPLPEGQRKSGELPPPPLLPPATPEAEAAAARKGGEGPRGGGGGGARVIEVVKRNKRAKADGQGGAAGSGENEAGGGGSGGGGGVATGKEAARLLAAAAAAGGGAGILEEVGGW